MMMGKHQSLSYTKKKKKKHRESNGQSPEKTEEQYKNNSQDCKMVKIYRGVKIVITVTGNTPVDMEEHSVSTSVYVVLV